MQYIILMIHPEDGRPVPLLDESGDDLATFDDYEEAEETADQHPAASAWGYEIIDWPWGIIAA